MSQYNAYLMHYGVKGMRWGVHKAPEQTSGRRRTPSGKAELGQSTNVAKQLGSRSLGQRVKTKLSDPEFQRKAATAAKIALVIGAAYATHKIINDPRILAAGKDAITKVAAKSGNIKTSTINSIMNSTEFKVASSIGKFAKTDGVKAVKTAADATGKVLKKIGSEDTKNIITGIGAMAGTTAILRNQIRDFRENKPDGDKFDQAVKRTQQLSEIGENVNNLARGPKGATAPTTSSTSSSSSSNSSSSSIPNVAPSKKGVDKSSKEYQDLFKGQDESTRNNIRSLVKAGYDVDQIKKHLNHSAVSNSSSGHGNLMQDSKSGKTVRTNKPLTLKDSKRISDYQKQHPNKSLEDTLNDLDLLDKDYAKHSAIKSGWRFTKTAGCRYIL